MLRALREPRVGSARALFGGSRLVALMLCAMIITSCDIRRAGSIEPCTYSIVRDSVDVDPIDKVDLLMVIDNSASMTEEQEKLSREVTRMVRVLSSGDLNPDDGIVAGADFAPLDSVRVGVVTTDMGTAPFPETCVDSAPLGDDGQMLSLGAVERGCEPLYPRFQEFSNGDDPVSFAFDVTCVATPGAGGCVFEQPLDAMLKAITPSADQTLPFRDELGDYFVGTGHGDTTNKDFLRDDALLVVILLTDEDDCSVRDPNIFRDDFAQYPGLRNTRCAIHPQAAWPVSRYVDGLLSLKQPDRLIFAGITGVDQGVLSGSGSFDKLLADSSMDIVVNPVSDELLPACESEDGRGFPARRIVQVAKGLESGGAESSIHSICADSYTSALDIIVEKVAVALQTTCLPRPVVKDPDGFYPCRVIETLSDGDCSKLPGRRLITSDAFGFASQCEILQVREVDAATQSGWYYQERDIGQCGQRLTFTLDANPAFRGNVSFECLQRAYNESALPKIGTYCGGDNALCARGGEKLFCEAITETCQQHCTVTADCPRGLECGDPAGRGQNYCAVARCE